VTFAVPTLIVVDNDRESRADREKRRLARLNAHNDGSTPAAPGRPEHDPYAALA
jgi:hypothetical protein